MQKFENMDLIAALEAIMHQNTAYYQSDFAYDIKMLREAARSDQPEDNSLATRATVSNLGLLWQVSKSMIVRAFILSRSANFLCVKCCRLRSDRTFHANKSRGLFTIHHLYLIVGCAIAHINNHTTHIV